ncbi:MAG: hypothetical protein EBU33_00030 [Sphingobacteriia bacterium]|nr:hypothetical protein [Sphingobacteriia bacterium]
MIKQERAGYAYLNAEIQLVQAPQATLFLIASIVDLAVTNALISARPPFYGNGRWTIIHLAV